MIKNERGIFISGIAVLCLFAIVSFMASMVYVEDELSQAAQASVKVEKARWVMDANGPENYYGHVESVNATNCAYARFDANTYEMKNNCNGTLLDVEVRYSHDYEWA